MEPRIIVLVLASDDTQYYKEFQKSWMDCMHRYPQLDYYFYKADPTMTVDADVSGHNIKVRMTETLDNVWRKWLATLSILRDKLTDYDFILRPNLSSVFFFDRYLAAARDWPRKQFCTAVVGVYNGGLRFPSGSGFTISVDIAERLVLETPPEIFWDDVSLGGALRSWGIPIVPSMRYDVCTHAVQYSDISHDTYHVRIKTNNRMADACLHRRLLEQAVR